MEHLDNLAIMNYLQGHGLSGGGLIGGIRHRLKNLTGDGLSGGVITEETQKGAQAYRDFIKHEVDILKKTRKEAKNSWMLYKKQPEKLKKKIEEIELNKEENKNLWAEYKKKASELKKVPKYEPKDHMPVEIDENLKNLTLPMLKKLAKQNNIYIDKIDMETGEKKKLNKNELIFRISKQFKLRGINYEKEPKKTRYPTKNITDKSLVALNKMTMPELRKYAKEYITLSKLDKKTGKRIQLKKKEIIKKLGAHNL